VHHAFQLMGDRLLVPVELKRRPRGDDRKRRLEKRREVLAQDGVKRGP
jgi:hypothetical protein